MYVPCRRGAGSFLLPLSCLRRLDAAQRRSGGPRPVLRRAHTAARGFTLIEILAVIVLVVLTVTLVAVSVGTGLEGARVRAAGKELAAALRYTRTQAIVQREAQVLVVDVEKRTYQAPGRKPVELPPKLELKLLTAAQEQVGDGVGQIRFFPDGSSTGGHIELILDDASWRIDVGWLTGEVLLRRPGD
jgi:general secretion pathway protein H